MTLILLCALIFSAVGLAFLACMCLVLREELEAAQTEHRIARAWADKYRRQADALYAELSTLRRDYAALLAAHRHSTISELGDAWRAGVRKGKGKA